MSETLHTYRLPAAAPALGGTRVRVALRLIGFIGLAFFQLLEWVLAHYPRTTDPSHLDVLGIPASG